MARILITDLSVETHYAVQVRSKRDGAVSEWSSILDVQTVKDTTPPGPVTNLTFATVGSSFVANWDAPTINADGSDLNGDLKDYVITLTVAPTVGPPATIQMTRTYYTEKVSFELTQDANIATFFSYQGVMTITVQARDYADNIGPGVSKTAAKATPNPVTGLTSVVKGTSFVTTWTPPTQNTDGSTFDDLKYYEVSITDGTYTQYFQATQPIYTFSFDDVKGIFGAMRFSLTIGVKVVNAVGAKSTGVTTTVTKPPPGPPTGLTWVSVGDAFSGSWVAPAGVDDLAGYDVTVTANGLSVTYPVAGTKFDLSAEENGKDFTTGINRTPQGTVAISVKSRDSLGQLSTAVTATASNPVPNPPTALTGVAIYDAIQLAWTAPTLNVDGSNFDDLKFYEIQVSSDGTTFTGSWYLGTDPQYTHTTVSASNLWFRVRVYDKFMQASGWSNTVGPFKPKNAIQVDTTPPAQVTGVTAVALNPANTTPSGLRVAWTAVANPNNDLAGYKVRYAPQGSTNYQFVDVPADQLTIDIEGLTSGRAYTVWVRAYDFVANNGAWSAPVNASANTETPIVIPPKTDLAVPASSPTPVVTSLFNALEARWPVVANADPITYEVHLGTTAGFTPDRVGTTTKVAEVSGTFAIIRTLPNGGGPLSYGTTYYVKTWSKDADGPAAAGSAASNGATISSVDNGDIAAGAVRTNQLFASSVTADKINFSIGGGNLWSNSSFENAVSYFAGWTVYSNDGVSVASRVPGRLGGYAARMSWSAATTVPQGIQRVAPGGWKGGQWYSVSFWSRGGGVPVGMAMGHNHNIQPSDWTWISNPVISGTWQRYVGRVRWSADHADPIFLGVVPPIAAGTNWIEFDDMQVEEGEVASNYGALPGEVLPGTITGTQIANNSISTPMISTNGLDAGVLTANSAFTTNLSVASTFTINASGAIQSSNYGGVNGFQLTSTGLNILSGTVAARALQIQEGSNIVPPQYADFEFRSDFYTAGMGAAGSTFVITTDSKYNGQAIRWSGTGVQQKYIYLAPTFASYNIPVVVGEQYIFSVWIKNNLAAAKNVSLSVRSSDGTTYPNALPPTVIPASQGYTRYSGVFTVATGTTSIIPYLENNQGEDIDFSFDGVQIERKVAGSNTPSAWKPPGLTTIDGAVIRTGEIRSATTVAYDGTTQPMWSINTQGGAQLNEVTVRGKIVVGSGTNSAGALVQSNNYGGTGSQWAIKGDGTMEFRSGTSTSSRFQIGATGLEAWAGAVQTVRIASDGSAAFAGNLSGSSISNNGGTFAVTTAGVLTATSGTVGGWTLGSSSLTGGSLVLDSLNGQIYAGAGTSQLGFKAGVGIWAGSTSQNASAPFFVSNTGVLTAQSATLRGTFVSGDNSSFSVATNGDITSRGNMSVYGHIEVGASSSSADSYVIVRRPSNGAWVMLDGRGGTDTAIASSSGYFSVNYDGVLNCTNATVTGTIYANNGYFKGDITGASGAFGGSLSAGISISSPTITGGTVQTGSSGTWVRMIESQADALQFVSGGTVTAEIRGTMGVTGSRGIYLNVDTQIGNTQSIIYQVGRRKGQGGAPSSTRVRGGSFSVTCTSGAGSITWDAMDVVPNCVQVTLSNTGSSAYIWWVTNVSTGGCTLNVRYALDGAVPGTGNVQGYYYAESYV